jgi:hypothetical protein
MLLGVRNYIEYNDLTNDFVLGHRNNVWAAESWCAHKHAYADQPYFADFGAGYRSGYRDVAAGGNGCPPALPPRCYWTWKFQTAEGQGKVSAWYAGYPHGAAAAAQDCAGNWSNIQVAEHVRKQYSPEFQNGTMFLPEDKLRELSPPSNPLPVIPHGRPAEIAPPPQPQSPAPDLSPALPADAAANPIRMFRLPWSLQPDSVPANYGIAPANYGIAPADYGIAPANYDRVPADYGNFPADYDMHRIRFDNGGPPAIPGETGSTHGRTEGAGGRLRSGGCSIRVWGD